MLLVEFVEQPEYAETRKPFASGGLQKCGHTTGPRNFPNRIQRFAINARSDAFHN